MISIITTHYNEDAKNIITEAMYSAKKHLRAKCLHSIYDDETFISFNPGYHECCDMCKCKQGCRDISRAADYCVTHFAD